MRDHCQKETLDVEMSYELKIMVDTATAVLIAVFESLILAQDERWRRA